MNSRLLCFVPNAKAFKFDNECINEKGIPLPYYEFSPGKFGWVLSMVPGFLAYEETPTGCNVYELV